MYKERVEIDVCCVLSCSSEHDECLSGLHNCDENALCFNMVGGHSCSCKPGYTGNGTVCKGKHHSLSSAFHCVESPQPTWTSKTSDIPFAVVTHLSDISLHYIANQDFVSCPKTQLGLFRIPQFVKFSFTKLKQEQFGPNIMNITLICFKSYKINSHTKGRLYLSTPGMSPYRRHVNCIVVPLSAAPAEAPSVTRV